MDACFPIFKVELTLPITQDDCDDERTPLCKCSVQTLRISSLLLSLLLPEPCQAPGNDGSPVSVARLAASGRYTATHPTPPPALVHRRRLSGTAGKAARSQSSPGSARRAFPGQDLEGTKGQHLGGLSLSPFERLSHQVVSPQPTYVAVRYPAVGSMSPTLHRLGPTWRTQTEGNGDAGRFSG